MRIGVLAVAVAGLVAATANAEDEPFDQETTAELAAICASPGEAERHFCFGFIIGAGQFYTEMLRAELISALACPDPVPSIDQMRASFVAWAGANPQHGATRAIDGLIQAAAETWPCE